MPGTDSTTTEFTARHTIEVAAPADAVYAVIADAAAWPVIFPPAVHVHRTPGAGGTEQLDIWALANGSVKAWRSERVLDPERRSVRFRQLVTAAPVAAMSGTWQVIAGDAATRVVLDHRFAAADPDSVDWIRQALDTNSTAELAALAAAATADGDGSVATFAFADTVTVAAPAQPVFDFLYRADLWPQRLPHVGRVDLSYIDDAQILEMDTVNDAGEAHTTRSYRVVTGPLELSYKQTAVPDGFLAHHGRWSLTETPAGTEATSHHRVRVDLERLRTRLGVPDRAAVEARVRAALGGNSLRTLGVAKEFAETGRPVAAAAGGDSAA